MSIQAIIGIIAVFACILVLPVVITLRSAEKDEQHEKPAQRKIRLQSTDEYKRAEQSELVNEIVKLVNSVPDTVTAVLLNDSFTVLRRIDRIGEIVKIQKKKELHFPALDDTVLELVSIAAEKRLGTDYISSPRWIGKKKDRKQEGYYIFLDPKKTDEIITIRTEEAIYNGERTSDF